MPKQIIAWNLLILQILTENKFLSINYLNFFKKCTYHFYFKYLLIFFLKPISKKVIKNKVISYKFYNETHNRYHREDYLPFV